MRWLKKYVIMRMIPLFNVEGEARMRKKKRKEVFSFFLCSSWRSSRCSQNLFPDATGEKNENKKWKLQHMCTWRVSRFVGTKCEYVDIYPSCSLCLPLGFWLRQSWLKIDNAMISATSTELEASRVEQWSHPFFKASNSFLWSFKFLLTFERKFKLHSMRWCA